MLERGLSVDHTTVWRWVQRYAPILNQRMRREVRNPNRSWRVDETYVRVAGKWTYLYRAVDSEGNTIDFMLSPYRDLTAAKLFLRLALHRTGQIRPRVINVDGHPAYARAISELKDSRELGRRCRCRPSPYLNNVLEQDHRFIKKRIAASLGFRSFGGRSAENDRRLRGDAHDSQGSGPMVRKRRCHRTDPFHSALARHRCLKRSLGSVLIGPFVLIGYLQHIPLIGV